MSNKLISNDNIEEIALEEEKDLDLKEKRITNSKINIYNFLEKYKNDNFNTIVQQKDDLCDELDELRLYFNQLSDKIDEIKEYFYFLFNPFIKLKKQAQYL